MGLSKNVALVLGSGGARGMAHIGVIEELEKNGYTITSIAGTSIGSMVGGFYSAGKLNDFKDWVLQLDKLDVYNLFDFTLDSQGLIKGDRIFKKIEHIIPDRNIEELSIPFKAVAADINTGKDVVFEEGSLYKAIRASSAIPSVLTPVKYNDTELVDGGVLSPLPSKFVERNEGDILVVVDVSAPIKYKPHVPETKEEVEEQNEYLRKLNEFISKWRQAAPSSRPRFESNNILDLMNKSFRLIQNRLSQMLIEQYPPDILVQISRDSCSTFELYRAGEMVELGRKALQEQLQKTLPNSLEQR